MFLKLTTLQMSGWINRSVIRALVNGPAWLLHKRRVTTEHRDKLTPRFRAGVNLSNQSNLPKLAVQPIDELDQVMEKYKF